MPHVTCRIELDICIRQIINFGWLFWTIIGLNWLRNWGGGVKFVKSLHYPTNLATPLKSNHNSRMKNRTKNSLKKSIFKIAYKNLIFNVVAFKEFTENWPKATTSRKNIKI